MIMWKCLKCWESMRMHAHCCKKSFLFSRFKWLNLRLKWTNFLWQTIDWTNQERVDWVKGIVYVNNHQMVELKTDKPLTFIRKINSLDHDVKVRLSRFGLRNIFYHCMQLLKNKPVKYFFNIFLNCNIILYYFEWLLKLLCVITLSQNKSDNNCQMVTLIWYYIL